MNYLSFNDAMRARFGTKVYRLSLQSGCTCPNRDGTIGTGGCTFCSEGGSGDFAAPLLPIGEQIEEARKRVDAKISASIAPQDRRYIAYFQSYTNTYGDPERLRRVYSEALQHPQIVALDLGTRPDCLPPEMIAMLRDLRSEYDKPVWIELGLQTIHEKTAGRISRGYKLEVFEDAYRRLKDEGFEVIVHVILGRGARRYAGNRALPLSFDSGARWHQTSTPAHIKRDRTGLRVRSRSVPSVYIGFLL